MNGPDGHRVDNRTVSELDRDAVRDANLCGDWIGRGRPDMAAGYAQSAATNYWRIAALAAELARTWDLVARHLGEEADGGEQ